MNPISIETPKRVRPRVVIIGAGFGGLYAARTFAGKNVDVLLVDRQNFHTFTPLLYQVATCALDASDIAYPVRQIFYENSNIRFLMGTVSQIDRETKTVQIAVEGATVQERYDYLIVAAGSTTNYFGNASLEQHAFPLKDLNDAINLRTHILRLFEKATWTTDPETRKALTTLVVVGGGPTGLETAGALHELYNDVLKQEFPDLGRAQVILIEATDKVLIPYPAMLQQSALKQLHSLGVETILNTSVVNLDEEAVHLKDGRVIPTATLIWAAGVKASPIAELLGVTLQKSGRVPVQDTMEMVGQEEIYVVGDMAHLEDRKGNAYPMVIPVAKQQGILAAQNILRRLNGLPIQAFVYHDRGIMATIGRSRAVAWIYNRIPLTGFLAWVAWLVLHLLWLMGFRNRISVFVNWLWNYITYDRSLRLILRSASAVQKSQPAGAPEQSKP